MRRTAVACWLVIVAVCLCGPAWRAQSPPSSGNRVIAGVVLSAASGQPLNGANVTLQDTNGFKLVAESSTDAEGRFSFQNLPDGKFALTASHRGYIETTYGYHDGPFTAIVTGESLNTTGLVLSLPLLGSIFGTVVEDSGDPVPQAQLLLFRKASRQDAESVTRAGQVGADAMGNFEFPSLVAGTYFLCATGRPWYRPMGRQMGRSVTGVTINQPRSPLDVTYPLTCYPETIDPAGAEPISLNAGDRIEANVTLHPVPALHVLFQVPKDDSRGIPMPQLRQDIFGYSDFASPIDTVPRRGDQNDPGHATVELSVPAGQYDVELRNFSTPQDPGQRTTISVSSNDLSIDASTFQPMASVAGSLIVEGGLPARCAIFLVTENGEAKGPFAVGADGKFQIGGTAPGDYEVRLDAEGFNFAVTQLRVNGTKVDGRMLRLGSDPIDLTVFARKPVGSISGFVTRNGKPESGVFLVLVPANPGANRFAWQPNQSDSDGSFIFQNVNSGQYTVVAIEQGWTLDWSQLPVIGPYLAGGAQVTVDANSKEVHLKSPVEAQIIGAQHTH